MLNILIVDDDIEKIQDIRDEFIELIENGEVSIDYEMEIKKACSVLERKRIDLLILDVQLPSLSVRGGVSISGGVDLLKMVEGIDKIKKPGFIIGLTAFDDKYLDMAKEFEEYLWILLKYDKSSLLWKKQISDKVNYLIKSKKDLMLEETDNYIYDCAIITAVDVELESVLNGELNWKKIEIKIDSTIYYEAIEIINGAPIKFVLAKQHQMGMVSAATLTTKIIKHFKPKLVCMLGIAGGRRDEVNIGDLIIISETWDYGSGKIKSSTEGNKIILEPEPHQISIEPVMKEYFMSGFGDILYEIRRKWNNGGGDPINQDIRVHVGPLASGAAVIQNENVVTEFILPHNRKILGVDMESYAVYFASCNSINPKPKYLSIKAVCDYADQSKNDKYQKYSAFVSTEFFFSIVSELLKKL